MVLYNSQPGGDPYACPYKPGEVAAQRVVYFATNTFNPNVLRRNFLSHGFLDTNSRTAIAFNDCSSCKACMPLRVPVKEFELSRHQKKTVRRNSDLNLTWEKTKFEGDQYDLYRKYHEGRHAASGEKPLSSNDYAKLMGSSTHMQTLHHTDGRLLSVIYYDDMKDFIYGRRQIYNPEESRKRSLGTYGFLALIEFAKQRTGTNYVYLGDWAKDSPKIGYKSNFRPFEVMTDDGWEKYDPQKHTKGPNMSLVLNDIAPF